MGILPVNCTTGWKPVLRQRLKEDCYRASLLIIRLYRSVWDGMPVLLADKAHNPYRFSEYD